jgi:hypothetical protein
MKREWEGMLCIDDLTEEPEYQREFSSAKANELAKTFDMRASQQILVSRRSDGKMVIIDGRHTCAAAKKIGIKQLSARVIDGLTLQEEAALFRKRNVNRATVRAMDVYRARLVENEPVAMALKAAVEETGFALTKNHMAAMETKAVALCEELYKKSPAILVDTLRFIASLWREDKKNGDHALIGGVSKFIELTQNKPDLRDEMKRKLQAVSVSGLLQVAHARMTLDGLHGREAVLGALLDAYNKSRRNKLTTEGLR